MKKTWTLPLAVFALTLITAALSAPFAHADLRPSSEPVGDDADAFGGPPHSIAFQSNRDGNNEVYVMNPDGSDQTRLTMESRNDGRPDVSPNGKQIVFISNRIITETNPTGDFEIFVMNSDGSDVRQLTSNGAEDSWPRWSPNGRWIAFHSNVDGNFEIYVIRPDGKDLTRVTEYAGLDQYPEWSPNGNQLAIRRDTDLYLIDLDGSNPIQLTAGTTGFNQMASWSPDGKQLAFLSNRLGYGSVFVTDADGNNQINLTPKPDDVPASAWGSRAPAWSRNGQYIYFTGRRPVTSVNENIFVMNADGSGVTQLTSTTAPGVSAEAAVR
jgi:Tol biopolymer transport system component